MTHAFNLGTPEAEGGRSLLVGGQFDLHREFCASQGYIHGKDMSFKTITKDCIYLKLCKWLQCNQIWATIRFFFKF